MARESSAGFSFVLKLIVAALLAGLADYLFYRAGAVGATIGVFALGWAVALFVAVPGVRRRRGALVAVLAAIGFGMLLVEDPGPLAWTLFWTAISSAAVLARHPFDDALRWGQRLLLHASFGVIRPFDDQRQLLRNRAPVRKLNLRGALATLALPVLGGALFLALFAGANPIIAEMLDHVALPDGTSAGLHALIWLFALLLVWPSLRPHPRVTSSQIGELSLERVAPRVPTASIVLSLLTFNALFAMQNALDIAFLWSGARLPGTLTMADYAHRGAAMLMATALLAALFVVLFLRPGSDSAGRPAVRALVALWVAQTILLVASSILRTLDYIGSYSLTVLRIWALGWMALVGVGLTLICCRLLFRKSSAWLINANALAAALLLAALAAVDNGAIAAQWNARHAREVGGPGVGLDLCYMHDLGPAALLPLIELEARVTDPDLVDRIRAVRAQAYDELVERQTDWHGWTWRGARTLAQAQTLLGPKPTQPRPTDYGRECDGSPTPPPPERTEDPNATVTPPPDNAASDDNAAATTNETASAAATAEQEASHGR